MRPLLRHLRRVLSRAHVGRTFAAAAVPRAGARVRRLSAVVLPAVAALLATARPAFAHGRLKSASPGVQARVTDVVRAIRLTFTEQPEAAVSAITLVGPNGTPVPLGAAALDPRDRMTLVAPVTGALPLGRYEVRWRMAGRDGHPVRGTYTFTVAGAAQPARAARRA